MSAKTNTFSSVQVSIPTGPAGSETSFAVLTIGAVHVDQLSKEITLEFPQSSQSQVGTKPLGCLSQVSAVVGDAEGRSWTEGRKLDVQTQGATRGASLYRFTFQSQADARQFAKLAESAQQMKRETWQKAQKERAVRARALETAIQNRFAECAPLVYTGVQLYGLHDDVEVLLGDGALVFVDPPAGPSTKVGSYELVFYGEEEGVNSPVKRLPIGPKMVLRRHVEEEDPKVIAAKAALDTAEKAVDAAEKSISSNWFFGASAAQRADLECAMNQRARAEHELNAVQRITRAVLEEDEDEGTTVSFDFASKDESVKYTITCSSASAAKFERDFWVRQRLMDLALMVSKRQHAVDDARSQLGVQLDQLHTLSLLVRARRLGLLILCPARRAAISG